MAKGKLILICQSGGEFKTKDDGTMSYENGEASAVNINQETLSDDLKLKLAEMCNLDQKTISIKYFLPGNRRTLITLRNDKDLKRMIDFHGNSVTADIFVSGKEGFDYDAFKKEATKGSQVKSAETVTHVSPHPTAATPVVHNVMPLRCYKQTSPPSQISITSPSSSEHDSASDTEYKPIRARCVDETQSSSGVDMDCSPADAVKKRRRTASWKIGDQGPTIVSDSDNRDKKRKSNSQRRNSLATSDNSEHQTDDILETNDLGSPSGFAFSDNDLPENLTASWKEGITGVGQDFKNVKEFREVLQKYAVAHRFVFKLKKNDPNRASGICVEEGCSWSIHASWIPTSESFRIKKFNNSHTCTGESWKNAHPAKNLMVSVIKDKLRESSHYKPREIAKSILQDFGIKLTYTQVWRGMDEAREQLQGSHKESYNRLPWFCEKIVETNPGSFAKMTTNDEKRLQYLFLSFKSSIQNFQNGCRLILFLDSTSLRSKYQEKLFTATAVDGNDGFFPVAFCIVDNENNDSWYWFLEQLKSAISTSGPLTFVSDREKGLGKPVNEIFENAYHGYSMHYLLESFKRNLKVPFNGEGRGVLPGKFLAAAHSVRVGGFKKYAEQIKLISTDAYDWVNQIEPEHWTSFCFKGGRYNYIVENTAEPYTKLIDKIRESTIMQKIEALIQMINDLISSRLTQSREWTTKLTPSKEKTIREESFKAKSLRVFISSDILFEVHDESTHVVNIEKWECTCLEWKENGLPCCHAIAALNSAGKKVYDYCSSNFTVEAYRLTYSESINPIPGLVGKEEADISDVKMLPPFPKSPIKKEEEIKTVDPDKRTVMCSKCKQPGHNKASCKTISEIPSLEMSTDNKAILDIPSLEISTDNKVISDVPSLDFSTDNKAMSEVPSLNVSTDNKAISDVLSLDLSTDNKAVSDVPSLDMSTDNMAILDVPSLDMSTDKAISDIPSLDMSTDSL